MLRKFQFLGNSRSVSYTHLDVYKRQLRGCVWASVIFVIEFTTGGILRLFQIEPWHYTGEFSIMGLIRIDYAPAWFAVGLLFERIRCV